MNHVVMPWVDVQDGQFAVDHSVERLLPVLQLVFDALHLANETGDLF